MASLVTHYQIKKGVIRTKALQKIYPHF